MINLVKERLEGLDKDLAGFSERLQDFVLTENTIGAFSELVCETMKALDYDFSFKDEVGNVMGVIKGYQKAEDMLLVSHMDFSRAAAETDSNNRLFPDNDLIRYKAGIISSVLTGALVKRSLLPLKGNLIVCCVPRIGGYDYGMKYFVEKFLLAKKNKIKGVILAEPTDMNVFLGHKGRFEYEIVVKGKLVNDFMERRGVNMLGTMFPLIHELERVSQSLPKDFTLGNSSLTIKDVQYSGGFAASTQKEFRIVVDREFTPEENSDKILSRARAIAQDVYQSESHPDVEVSTAIATQRMTTAPGLEIITQKEVKPWMMEGHDPFVLASLKALQENGYPAGVGYWQQLSTEGDYTHGTLGLPTIGFGAGKEALLGARDVTIDQKEFKRAILGTTLMIHRNIGIPTFGWSSDEI